MKMNPMSFSCKQYGSKQGRTRQDKTRHDRNILHQTLKIELSVSSVFMFGTKIFLKLFCCVLLWFFTYIIRKENLTMCTMYCFLFKKLILFWFHFFVVVSLNKKKTELFQKRKSFIFFRLLLDCFYCKWISNEKLFLIHIYSTKCTPWK